MKKELVNSVMRNWDIPNLCIKEIYGNDSEDFPKIICKVGTDTSAYHCPPVQQPYWNTVYLTDFPEDELLAMIDFDYDTVLHKFSKKKQREIQTDA